MNISEPELMELLAAAEDVARLEERLSWMQDAPVSSRNDATHVSMREMLASARKLRADLARRLCTGPHAPEGYRCIPCLECSGAGYTLRATVRGR